MQFRTMATQINDMTYSIAVACLDGSFAVLPRELVDGCYLVINQPETHYCDESTHPSIVIGNAWLSEKDFHNKWAFTSPEVEGAFVQVDRILDTRQKSRTPWTCRDYHRSTD